MKKSYLIDLPILLILAGLLFAIGCAEDGSNGMDGSISIDGPSPIDGYNGTASATYPRKVLVGREAVLDFIRSMYSTGVTMISKPQGSQVSCSGAAWSKCRFTPDLAGDYQIHVIASGTLGSNGGNNGLADIRTYTITAVDNDTTLTVTPADSTIELEDSLTLELTGEIAGGLIGEATTYAWSLTGSEACRTQAPFAPAGGLTTVLTVKRPGNGADPCSLTATLSATDPDLGRLASHSVTVTVTAPPVTGAGGGTVTAPPVTGAGGGTVDQ